MNIKIKKLYTHLKHKKRKIYNIDNKDINLIKLKDKIIDININIPLGTSSWENNRKEIRRAILEDNISDFINWNIIQKTMFYEAPKVEYEEVMKNSLLSKSIKENKNGNPKPYYLDSSTSGNLIHHAYNISKLFSHCTLEDFNTIVEIGGGYGSMCRLFRNMKYFEKYVIYDLPEFSALQNYYLDSIDTKYTKNTIFTGDINKLNGKESNILLIATWSLSEMLLELREKILEYLKFDYCVIAFQSEFDGINNIEYFDKFKQQYKNINFEIIPIKHLKGHFYLIGTKTV